MKANIIAVFDKEKEKVLVCRRRKNPYKGLLNFVGGKIEKEEDGLTAAYRELWEETGITDADIELTHLMDFNYLVFDNWLEVYFGRLNKDFTVRHIAITSIEQLGLLRKSKYLQSNTNVILNDLDEILSSYNTVLFLRNAVSM